MTILEIVSYNLGDKRQNFITSSNEIQIRIQEYPELLTLESIPGSRYLLVYVAGL